ncbi:MAG: DpnD/PcfM family protein [Muribaculaceae bacterium]|nr:DpnD/PcfM family protein [Muribaculaceae bacterium]
MTYVSSIFNSSLNSNRKLKYFSVEVITFDGDSITVEVEARSADEAQEIAASQFDNVDYTMIQSCFAGY